ncbi:hypothetical protein [Curtobacterium sp. MMLR14_010]|uniref:hypothetical protein n=1 Tax=Curtobacterium sp. MMLR14_010 TaxID=1898743 RepID=UPI001113FED5|nr:hypothetical protein [Curtobacterium sp. MMLR14_010]
MALRAPRRPSAPIEEAMGFVGFFGVVFLVVTVACELSGRPALGWALTLLALVLVLVVLDRWRVLVLRRTAATSDPSPAAVSRVAGGATRASDD